MRCAVPLANGAAKGAFSTASAATSIEIALPNNGSSPDLILLTQDSTVFLDGASAFSSAPQSAALPVSAASASAVGLFAYDRRAFMQVAVLDGSGTLHVFARSGLDHTTPTISNNSAPTQGGGHNITQSRLPASGSPTPCPPPPAHSPSLSPAPTASPPPSTCTASYPTSTLTAGPHTITATEAADPNYNTASATATLTVNAATSGTVVLAVSSPLACKPPAATSPHWSSTTPAPVPRRTSYSPH